MTNEQTDEIADALARAQATFEVPKKSKTANAGTYRYSYADLPDVLAAVVPSLTREGIAITQAARTELERQTVAVWTTLRRGAETIETEALELPVARLDVQGIGSAITYGRRYQLSALLGIAAEDDDDGAAAAGNASQGAAQSPEQGSPPARRARVSEAAMRRIHALAKTKGITHEQMRDWAGRHLGIETLAELDKRGAAELEKSLRELPDVQHDADATVESGGTAPAPGSVPRVAPSSDDAGPAGDGSGVLIASDGVAGGTASP